MLLEAALADFSEQRKWDGDDELDGGTTSKSAALDTSPAADRSSSDEDLQRRKPTIMKKQQERNLLKRPQRRDQHQQRAGFRRSNSTDSSSSGKSDVDERPSGTVDLVHESGSVAGGHRSSSATEATLEVISLDRSSGGTSSSGSSMSSDEARKEVDSPGRSLRSGTSESSGSGDEASRPLDSSTYGAGHGAKFDEQRHVPAVANSVKRNSLISERRQNAVARLRRSSLEEVGTLLQLQQHLQDGIAGERTRPQSRRSIQTGENDSRSTSETAFEWEGHPSAATVPKTNQEESSSSIGTTTRSDQSSHFHTPPLMRTSSAVAVDRLDTSASSSRDGCTITEHHHVTSLGTTSSSSSSSSGDRGIEREPNSMLTGKDPAHVSVRTNFSQRRAFVEWRGHNRADADPDSSSVCSDDASGSSPVSTLDLPFSPHSPTYSPPTQEAARAAAVGRHGGRWGGGGTAARGGAAPAPGQQQHHSTNSAFIGLGEMTDELPSVMEEDEEDLDSGSGFHTIEFETMESPEGMEGREDWSLSGKTHSAKSMSAPHSRQGSSLHPAGPANRGRRRSDFDWPEDFDERPEEVVKEVDDSLWAFSPVASTFVFSGNEASPSVRPGLHLTSSPGSSPGMMEHMPLKRNFVKSGFSTKHDNVTKSSMEASMKFGEFPARRKSSSFQHYVANGDDRYFGGATPPVKKSTFSCMPLFNLCGAQRPRSSLSFSQRLSPSPSRPSPRR